MGISKIDFIEVESSMIAKVAYQDRLYVQFKNGRIYSFQGVPKDLFDELALLKF